LLRSVVSCDVEAISFAIVHGEGTVGQRCWRKLTILEWQTLYVISSAKPIHPRNADAGAALNVCASAIGRLPLPLGVLNHRSGRAFLDLVDAEYERRLRACSKLPYSAPSGMWTYRHISTEFIAALWVVRFSHDAENYRACAVSGFWLLYPP
jgi:hypothetical protein